MPQILKGSCHCGAVLFVLQSSSAVPFAMCVCSICRKVGGSGGSINLGGDAKTLQVEGKESISIYNAVLNRGAIDEKRSSSERNFLHKCGSMLWLYDKSWPELIHPFASAIDTPLTSPDEMSVLMLDSKPEWVRLPEGKKKAFEQYPDESLEQWHKRHGKWVG